jgi:adenosine/AMP kinase
MKIRSKIDENKLVGEIVTKTEHKIAVLILVDETDFVRMAAGIRDEQDHDKGRDLLRRIGAAIWPSRMQTINKLPF